MKLELVGFKICPFVQRVSLLLLRKNIEHRVTWLNPKEPPAWLAEVSPLGKVPLLRLFDDAGEAVGVVFESQVINEFLDESFTPALMPDTPLARARQRGFVALADGLLGQMWNWVTAKDDAAAEQARANLCQSLQVLDAALAEDAALAGGQRLNMVDCAMLPVFMRLHLLEQADAKALPCQALPRVAHYRNQLLAAPEAETSVVDNFSTLYLGFVKAQEGVLRRALA